MRSTNENMLLWGQKINERTKSGITIEEWCKKNEVSIYKYHYWNNRISEKQKSDEETTFAEVTSTLSNTKDVISYPVKSDDFQIFFKNIQEQFHPISVKLL